MAATSSARATRATQVLDEGEEDGEFQAAWLAGFQNGRPANSVHDDIWSRTVVLRQGDTTVALVSLDVVGFFYDDVEKFACWLLPRASTSITS